MSGRRAVGVKEEEGEMHTPSRWSGWLHSVSAGRSMLQGWVFPIDEKSCRWESICDAVCISTLSIAQSQQRGTPQFGQQTSILVFQGPRLQLQQYQTDVSGMVEYVEVVLGMDSEVVNQKRTMMLLALLLCWLAEDGLVELVVWDGDILKDGEKRRILGGEWLLLIKSMETVNNQHSQQGAP